MGPLTHLRDRITARDIAMRAQKRREQRRRRGALIGIAVIGIGIVFLIVWDTLILRGTK
jgi:hypothetical protein